MTAHTAVVEPDLEFIRHLNDGSGNALKQCFQCGTCSAACELSPDRSPFPRKEMAWAAWGLKDRLLNDPDVWLCHQCNDCSVRCPRGARPGDVLAVVRREAIIHHARPSVLGRWASQPSAIPLLLGIPAALLTLALLVRDPIQQALGWTPALGTPILFAYSRMFPRWLLNGVFLGLTALVLILMAGGMAGVWRSMRQRCQLGGAARPARGLIASIASVVTSVLMHEAFVKCTESRSRYWSHLAVFFGFLALTLVTLWVITAPYNPLVSGTFVYPFTFLSPWKILANAGGALLLAGCVLMIWDRLREREHASVSTFTDWALVATLILVVLTGYITEVLHYIRLEPHRHLAYFAHLVFIGALLLYLPYSKFAHVVYRTTALVGAEYYGRTTGGPRVPPASNPAEAHNG